MINYQLFRRNTDAANMVTTVNVVISIASLITIIKGYFEVTVFLLFAAVLLDHVDGMLARGIGKNNKVQRVFGKAFDSYADLLNFCVVPALTLIVVLDNYAGILVAASIIIFGVYRLCNFDTLDNPKDDTGLQTTYMAFAFCCLFSLYVDFQLPKPVLAIGCAIISLFQVSSFKIVLPSSKKLLIYIPANFALIKLLPLAI